MEKVKKIVFVVLNYLQIAISALGAIKFPGWLKSGSLDDDYFIPGLPLWLVVGVAVFGSLIMGIRWTILRKRKTGSWI